MGRLVLVALAVFAASLYFTGFSGFTAASGIVLFFSIMFWTEITVDWVVLTAALVGLGMAVIATLSPAIDATADTIVGNLMEQQTND